MSEGDPNLIWIEDAVKEYERSRSWLDLQLASGVLTYAKYAGSRRTYLRRDELDRLLRPTEARRGERGDGTGEGREGGASDTGEDAAG